jgi:hypothetical protein
MKEAKSPAPTPVRVEMEPTRISVGVTPGADELTVWGAVVGVDGARVVVGADAELEQDAATPATITMAPATASRLTTRCLIPLPL